VRKSSGILILLLIIAHEHDNAGAAAAEAFDNLRQRRCAAACLACNDVGSTGTEIWPRAAEQCIVTASMTSPIAQAAALLVAFTSQVPDFEIPASAGGCANVAQPKRPEPSSWLEWLGSAIPATSACGADAAASSGGRRQSNRGRSESRRRTVRCRRRPLSTYRRRFAEILKRCLHVAQEIIELGFKGDPHTPPRLRRTHLKALSKR